MPDPTEKSGKFCFKKTAVEGELAALKNLSGGRSGGRRLQGTGGDVNFFPARVPVPARQKWPDRPSAWASTGTASAAHRHGEKNDRPQNRQHRRHAHHERFGPGADDGDFKSGVTCLPRKSAAAQTGRRRRKTARRGAIGWAEFPGASHPGFLLQVFADVLTAEFR